MMGFSELPMDLVMGEILPRLPAKSLMRFTCVSKLWLSVIHSQYFSNRFLTFPSPRIYMCLWDRREYGISEILSLAPPDTKTTTPSSFVVDHDLTNPKMGEYILQNLGGFMCYKYWKNPRMYNPVTRQFLTLPFKKSKHMIAPPGGEKTVTYYFGYDSVHDKYKVVSLISIFLEEPLEVISSENWIFVLKHGRGSWKKAALPPTDFCPHLPSKGGLCIDGIIYYMAWIDIYTYVVVSFDIRSEEFNMIQVPEVPGTSEDVTLSEYGGKATLFDSTNLKDKGVMDFWIVEDAKNKKLSCKSLVVKPSQLHLVNNNTFEVKSTTQNGNVLLIPKDFLSPFHILSYDLQNNDMRKIEIRGIPDRWFNTNDEDDVHFDVMFMDQSESVIYSDFLSSLDWTKRDNQGTPIPNNEKAILPRCYI